MLYDYMMYIEWGL